MRAIIFGFLFFSTIARADFETEIKTWKIEKCNQLLENLALPLGSAKDLQVTRDKDYSVETQETSDKHVLFLLKGFRGAGNLLEAFVYKVPVRWLVLEQASTIPRDLSAPFTTWNNFANWFLKWQTSGNFEGAFLVDHVEHTPWALLRSSTDYRGGLIARAVIVDSAVAIEVAGMSVVDGAIVPAPAPEEVREPDWL